MIDHRNYHTTMNQMFESSEFAKTKIGYMHQKPKSFFTNFIEVEYPMLKNRCRYYEDGALESLEIMKDLAESYLKANMYSTI